jgi:protoporphyrinogen oxidase
LNLIKELNLDKYLRFPKTVTSVFYQGKIYPLNSAFDVLSFSPLSLPLRIRLGLVTAFLKILPSFAAMKLETTTALNWLKHWYGVRILTLLWQPLFWGKFGKHAPNVNMTWFWARIKKRTPRLGYLEGGYQRLVEAMAAKIKEKGGKIFLQREFHPLQELVQFDKVIVTTPSFVFAKIFPSLPYSYKKRLTQIPHLHALNFVLITREKFLQKTYWLNISDPGFPFIGIIQQTNMMAVKYYGGNHIAWVANYLPPDHPYLKMTKEELLKVYLPYLKKINSEFSILDSKLFFGPFAQPVFPANYSKIRPQFTTPLPNIDLANMDMVYPWDRGTNYAIELGYKVAKLIHSSTPGES